MAILKDFIYSGARAGMPLDIYLNRWPQIGEGKFVIVEPLRLAVEGRVKIFGEEISGKVEIIMPDASPQGTCTVIFNGVRYGNCPYRTNGGTLEINAPPAALTLQANDRKWSWVHVSSGVLQAWSGLWPQGENDVVDAFFGGKEQPAAP